MANLKKNLLLFPGVMLGYEEDEVGSPLEVHMETRVPFTGKKVDIFRCWRGISHFVYISLQNGKRNGLTIGFLGNGIITKKENYQNNLYHGINEQFYINGLKRECAIYVPWKKRRSKLISIKVWQPSGVKCPHSFIDDEGNGMKYSYNETGEVNTITFFENFDCRAQVYSDDQCKRFETAWLFTGKKFYDHKEINLL